MDDLSLHTKYSGYLVVLIRGRAVYVIVNACAECSTRGVVEWLIKHEAKPSALSDTRPLLECCKSCTARPSARINWLIV